MNWLAAPFFFNDQATDDVVFFYMHDHIGRSIEGLENIDSDVLQSGVFTSNPDASLPSEISEGWYEKTSEEPPSLHKFNKNSIKAFVLTRSPIYRKRQQDSAYNRPRLEN